MPKGIKFNTGRKYSDEGQIITAEEFGGDYDKLDLFDPNCPDQWIEFTDHTRNIKGKILFCRLEEDEIMSRYDSGDYINI